MIINEIVERLFMYCIFCMSGYASYTLLDGSSESKLILTTIILAISYFTIIVYNKIGRLEQKIINNELYNWDKTPQIKR